MTDPRDRPRYSASEAAPLPPGLRHLVEAAMSRRVRSLHVKDLDQLKAHVESRAAH
ncbi:hypothetical protein [Mycolicibacterium chubuense]|uniref:hypothetical protein n=1 Tax=Mycolicibacterium chubuense TaxID=1800 RepID=UPI000A65F881|nr:hypothetical protein [Mycolicibacterium chubuense]